MKRTTENIDTAWLKTQFAEELIRLKAGNSTNQTARAMVALGNGLMAVVRLEMDFSRFVSSQRADSDSDEQALKSIALATVTS